MKVVALREAKQKLSEWAKRSQDDPVLVTKHGKPWAFPMGAGVYDWEDITYMTDQKFWRMIERARRQSSVPLAEIHRKYSLPPTAARRNAKRTRR